MITLVAFIKSIPARLYGVVALVALAAAGMLYTHSKGNTSGRAAVQAQWDADKAARAAAETKAVVRRAAENLALAKQQAATALAITKAYDDEINDVRARLAAERMRKPAFCAGVGPTVPADADGTASGAAADSASGLLPDAVARDIQALILQTEEVAATGRACQAFVQGNGMGL